jgi:hypothetical protein
MRARLDVHRPLTTLSDGERAEPAYEDRWAANAKGLAATAVRSLNAGACHAANACQWHYQD